MNMPPARQRLCSVAVHFKKDHSPRATCGRRREAKGLSQGALAADAAIYQDLVSRIENGAANPELDTLGKSPLRLGCIRASCWTNEKRLPTEAASTSTRSQLPRRPKSPGIGLTTLRGATGGNCTCCVLRRPASLLRLVTGSSAADAAGRQVKNSTSMRM
jgi:Helix-turn-helix